jgi:hypothetical protein
LFRGILGYNLWDLVMLLPVHGLAELEHGFDGTNGDPAIKALFGRIPPQGAILEELRSSFFTEKMVPNRRWPDPKPERS